MPRVAVIDMGSNSTRLLVADIAPVPYPPRQARIVNAMRAVPLRPGLSRREADAVRTA